MALKRGLYKGFSSFEFQRAKTFKINDIELVKLDLLNHIFTRKGSRVMLPDFGTIIPELVFEPLDADTVNTVEEELITVFEFDPRVELIELDVQPDFERSSITAAALLNYIELETVDRLELNLQFER